MKKAFLNINDELARQIKEFEISNSWLTDYSVFMAVKVEENMKPWWEWSDEHAHYFECIKDIYSYEKSAAFGNLFNSFSTSNGMKLRLMQTKKVLLL